MRYVSDVLNRATGDLDTIEIGDWLTITEFGRMIDAGPRETRSILHRLDFLQPETTGKPKHTRMRICPWVTDRGWGKRINKRGCKGPFDVISPAAQEWLLERVEAVKVAMEEEATKPSRKAAEALSCYAEWRSLQGMDRETGFTVGMQFSWLADRHPDLSQEEVASVLGVTQQLVSKLSLQKQGQIMSARRRLKAVLPKLPSRPTSWDLLEHQ